MINQLQANDQETEHKAAVNTEQESNKPPVTKATSIPLEPTSDAAKVCLFCS